MTFEFKPNDERVETSTRRKEPRGHYDPAVCIPRWLAMMAEVYGDES